MAVQLIPYMTAAVAVHALLLSLGGLLVVNSLRSLSQLQQEVWEHRDDLAKKLHRAVLSPGKGIEIDKVETRISLFMKANLVVGFFGILYSLFAIVFLSEVSQVGVLIIVSLGAVAVQLGVFALIALGAMDMLATWLKKFA